MRVSVVIPTWNRAGLLLEALGSVFAQTRPADEVIVVDDGSTDDTVARLEALGDRVRLVRRRRGGAAAARNAGVRAATGDWLAFLDSDDLWEPTKLEKQIAALRRDGTARLVFCDSRAVDREGRPIAGHQKPVHGGRITAILFEHVFVHTPSVFVDRALFESLGGFREDLRVCEDYDLWLRASLETPFLLVAEPLFVRRVHSESLAHEENPESLECKCRVLDAFSEDPRARRVLPPDVIRRRLARVHFTAARTYRRWGMAREAARHFDRVRTLQPWNLRAWWMRNTVRAKKATS